MSHNLEDDSVDLVAWNIYCRLDIILSSKTSDDTRYTEGCYNEKTSIYMNEDTEIDLLSISLLIVELQEK